MPQSLYGLRHKSCDNSRYEYILCTYNAIYWGHIGCISYYLLPFIQFRCDAAIWKMLAIKSNNLVPSFANYDMKKSLCRLYFGVNHHIIGLGKKILKINSNYTENIYPLDQTFFMKLFSLSCTSIFLRSRLTAFFTT